MSRRKRKRNPVAASKQLNMPVMEAFGDIIDPTEYLNDEPGWGGQNVAAYLVSRDRGGNAPTFSTDQELAGIRGASRIICDASVNAKCALQNLTNYVIGTGFKYNIVDKNRIIKPGEESTPLAKDAMRIIDEFLQRTKYGTAKRRKRLLWQQRRDGEVFVTLWHVGMGKAEYRVTDPGFFITPFDTRSLDDMFPTPDGSPSSWSFGVHTPDDDYEQHIGYYAQYSDSSADYEYFDQTRIVYSRINVDDAIKRGLSDFYWVYTSLSDASKLLRNGVRGAAVLSAIAAIVEHPQGTDAEQVNSFKSGSSVSSYTEPTRRGGRTQYVHKYNSGSILHVPNGQKYQPSPLASTGVASSIIEIEQAVLRIIGSNWCMPEFMISSDASNNNYASILVSGSPFVKFVEAVQAECQEDDEALLWKVLGIANEAGQFARGRDLESIKEEIEIKVESPQASIKDESKEHLNNEVLSRNGLLSNRTWATKAGLDYDQEVANGASKLEVAPLSNNDPTLNNIDDNAQPAVDADGNPLPPTDPATASSTSAQNMTVEAPQGLNGAQVTAALELMVKMSSGEVAPTAALELLIGIGIEQTRAQRMIAAQSAIEIKEPEPVQPVSQQMQQPPQAQQTKESRLREAARLLWGDYPGSEE